MILALSERRQIEQRFAMPLDEPDTFPFLARLREDVLLNDSDWNRVCGWLNEALVFLNDQSRPLRSDGATVLDLDADPRTANWLRTINVQRLAGHRMPLWACLRLWWLGRDRKTAPFGNPSDELLETWGFPMSNQYAPCV
jgi:hypothetical protein